MKTLKQRFKRKRTNKNQFNFYFFKLKDQYGR